ncbi:hypothetical protein [Variovorax sp. UC122_21]|uniref:hypothetical protein n=1 Tax=Variovorax sp. UC122_21 TaxID=3374554 RepID=UPI00375653D1
MEFLRPGARCDLERRGLGRHGVGLPYRRPHGRAVRGAGQLAPTPNLQIHANLGADWAPGTGQRTTRGGLACEWALNDTLSLIAERSRVSRLWTSRVGARVNLTPLISLDLSASRTGPQGMRGVVIGLNHEFSWH